MAKKVAKNIFKAEAKLYPPGESIDTRFGKISEDIRKIALARSHKKKAPVIFPDPNPICGKWVKNARPATILYKKLPDDMILITGFENFLSMDEVRSKYGEDVAKVYFAYTDSMKRMHVDGGREGVEVGKTLLWSLSFTISCGPNKSVSNECQKVYVGDIYRKQDFSKIIAHVKKCGALLHDIIQACDKGEVKRIEI